MPLECFPQAAAHQFKSFLPAGRAELAIFSEQRPGDAFCMVGEIERIAALDTKKVAVDSALVAVVAAHNFHSGVGAAGPQSCFTAVGAVRTGGSDVLHLPWAGLVAIGARCESAHRAD